PQGLVVVVDLERAEAELADVERGDRVAARTLAALQTFDLLHGLRLLQWGFEPRHVPKRVTRPVHTRQGTDGKRRAAGPCRGRGGALRGGHAPAGRSPAVAAPARPVDHAADLARPPLRPLAPRTGGAPVADPPVGDPRRLRWPGVARRRAVPHVGSDA